MNRTSWTLKALIALTLTFTLGINQAPAQLVAFDNLGNPSADNSSANDSIWLAQQFTTNNQSYSLISVTLLMQRNSGSGEATVEIWSNSGGDPGSQMYSFNGAGTYFPTLTNTSFIAPAGGILAANSTYWLVLKGDAANEFGWSYSSIDSGSGFGFSTEWRMGEVGKLDFWSGSNTQPFQMQLNVQAVPEPSSMVLLGMGMSAMGMAYRRRMKRKLSEREPTTF